MRFIKNLYISALAVVAGALAFTGCQPEESPLSRAIMTSVSGLEFAAQNAEPQTITVYADADWTVEAPDWVTVDKTSGSRTMDVTISVGDNMRDGAMDNPKKDTIVFRGYNLLSNAYVIVSQGGDKYRDVPPVIIPEVYNMKDEDVVILDHVAVVAVSANGFVVNDGNESIYVASKEDLVIGDGVHVRGSKGTLNDIPAITVCDLVEKKGGNYAPAYPLIKDITPSLDAYAPAKMEYVELTGSLDGVNVAVEGAVRVGTILDPSAEFDLAALNGHNVTVKGFSFGATVSVVNIIVTEIVDLGVNEIIYFTDNFDWVSDLAIAAGAGDSMGVNGDDSAKNAYTAVEGFADLLAAQGYEDLFPSSKTIYLQTNYLKFSKGKNTNGIRFPAVDYGGTVSVVLTFDWGVHVGSGGQDQTELVLEIEGNGVADKTAFTHTAGEWEWQTETVTISGIDANSRIVLKPTTFTGVVDAGYYRWYLDNIKIIDAGGAVVTPPSGDKVYFEETWDWVAPWADAYGSGDSVGDNDHSGKAPNVYTHETQAGFIDEFKARGYVDLNPDGKVMYTQKYYMKFGKTNVHTGITLPANDFEGDTPVDVDITFDWCAHMITKEPYTFDKVQMVVELSGPGVCADSNAQLSNAYDSNQKDGQMEWQKFSVRLNGVTKDTRISIRPLNWKKTGADGDEYKVQRYHLDNIKIASAK
ncbi:MAG: BACON domain-containing protein [Bacteroidales bacterium]|nr:BACON domain-containing protein [Bacteroidales bacterium]